MRSTQLVVDLNQELSAVSDDLVGNQDLLRGVLAGSGDCIKILDLDGRLQFMSEGGKRVMEVDNFGALKGCPWPSFWAGQGNAEATAAVEGAKAGKTMHFRGAADTAKGTPRFWDVQVSPIYGRDGKIEQLLSISRDITDEWDAQQRAKFLTEELEHRVKNSFAMVLGIANQTFRGAEHATALEAFNQRIVAMSRAFDLTRTSKTGASIGEVIHDAISSHRSEITNIAISGPAVNLSIRKAITLTLAINELATNSLKYGAMSTEAGLTTISWALTDTGEPTISLRWIESGGPAVVAPTRRGFGTRLIKDFLAQDFGGVVSLAYEPTGLSFELNAPKQTLSAE